MRTSASAASRAVVLLVAALAAAEGEACRSPSPCPEGLEIDATKTEAGKTLWCKSPDGARRRYTEFHAATPEAKRQTCAFVDGRPEGQYLAWHKNGRTWVEGTYRDGVKNGKWLQWDENGAKIAEGEYRRGEFVAGAPVGFVASCEQVRP